MALVLHCSEGGEATMVLAILQNVVLVLLAAVLTVLSLAVARVIQNTLLNGKAPPVHEGIPLIGGLMKFIKVGSRRAQGGRDVLCGAMGWLRACWGRPTEPCPTCMRGFPCPSPLPQGPMYLMKEGYSKFGDVFTVPVLHKRITFLIGPAVSPHFFKATDEEMSQTEVRAAETAQA